MVFDGENDDASDCPDVTEQDLDDRLKPVENKSLTIHIFLLKEIHTTALIGDIKRCVLIFHLGNN